MKKTATKKKGPKPWRALPLEHYQSQCDELVTHSIKGVNTNAGGGGIRVIPVMDAQTPYACVRFGREAVALDYTKNSTKPFSASVATEQLEAIRLNDFHRFSEVDYAQCAILREHVLPLLERHYVAADSHVSPRMRQILVEDSQGGDISLTPLHSGGFSARLDKLTTEALEGLAADKANQSGHPAFFDEIAVKFGGDKAQNAGRMHLMVAMQRTYRFAVPTEKNTDIRKAIAIHHRGVSTMPPRFLLEEYEQFLRGLRMRDEKQGLPLQRTDRRMHREYDILARMVRPVLDRGDTAYALIAPYVGNVLDEPASRSLPLVQRGLINPDLRTEEWKEDFAREISLRIASAKNKDGVLIVGISGRSAESLCAHILEAL